MERRRYRLLTENLFLHILIRVVIGHGNGDTPLEISGDGARTKTTLKPRINKHTVTVDYSVRGPFSLSPGLFDPVFRTRLEFIKAHIYVRRHAGYNFVRLILDAAGVDKLHSVESPATSITLIAARILIAVWS
jgi:hypothetical protein